MLQFIRDAVSVFLGVMLVAGCGGSAGSGGAGGTGTGSDGGTIADGGTGSDAGGIGDAGTDADGGTPGQLGQEAVWTLSFAALTGDGNTCSLSLNLHVTVSGNTVSGKHESGVGMCSSPAGIMLASIDRGAVINGVMHGASVEFDLDTPDNHFTGTVSDTDLSGTAALTLDLFSKSSRPAAFNPWFSLPAETFAGAGFALKSGSSRVKGPYTGKIRPLTGTARLAGLYRLISVDHQSVPGAHFEDSTKWDPAGHTNTFLDGDASFITKPSEVARLLPPGVQSIAQGSGLRIDGVMAYYLAYNILSHKDGSIKIAGGIYEFTPFELGSGNGIRVLSFVTSAVDPQAAVSYVSPSDTVNQIVFSWHVAFGTFDAPNEIELYFAKE